MIHTLHLDLYEHSVLFHHGMFWSCLFILHTATSWLVGVLVKFYEQLLAPFSFVVCFAIFAFAHVDLFVGKN